MAVKSSATITLSAVVLVWTIIIIEKRRWSRG